MKINVVFKSCHGKESVYDLSIPESQGRFPLIIFCHGFKGFKDWGHFNLINAELVKQGFIVLKFNFTFNGGTTSEVIDFPDLESFSVNNYLKEVEDIHHIIKALKHGKIKVDNWNNEIHLLGHSRGGGMATIAGAESEFVSKVVSWAGISDCLQRLPADDEIQKWKKEGVRFIKNGRTNQNMPMKFQFVETLINNQDRLSIKKASKKLGVNQLIIHGTADEAVSLTNGEDMNSWNPKSKLIKIEGANHVFGGKHPWSLKELPIYTAQAIEATVRFLK